MKRGMFLSRLNSKKVGAVNPKLAMDLLSSLEISLMGTNYYSYTLDYYYKLVKNVLHHK